MYHVIPINEQDATPDIVRANIPKLVVLDLQDAIAEFEQAALAGDSLVTIDLDILTRIMEYIADQTMLDYGIATLCEEMYHLFVRNDRDDEGIAVCTALKVFALRLVKELEQLGCYLPNGALPFKAKAVSRSIHVVLERNLEFV